jgi:hypothetical protein
MEKASPPLIFSELPSDQIRFERDPFKIEGAGEQSRLIIALPTNFLNAAWAVQLEMVESGKIKTCT